MIPPPSLKSYAVKHEKAAYVYLIKSLQIGKFYLGWTTNLKRRLIEHNSGKSQYTKSRGPWELVYSETYNSIHDAKRRERTLKHNPRMMFLFEKRALKTVEHNQLMEVVGDPTTRRWWDDYISKT